ncbi:hypothetical protein ACVQ27_004281, partial [Shigella boydii]
NCAPILQFHINKASNRAGVEDGLRIDIRFVLRRYFVNCAIRNLLRNARVSYSEDFPLCVLRSTVETQR